MDNKTESQDGKGVNTSQSNEAVDSSTSPELPRPTVTISPCPSGYHCGATNTAVCYVIAIVFVLVFEFRICSFMMMMMITRC